MDPQIVNQASHAANQLFVIGNIAWNTGLVGVSAFFVIRWMNKIEATMAENKLERKESNRELVTQIENVHTEMKIANGRTAKLEGEILTQKALCDERHS